MTKALDSATRRPVRGLALGAGTALAGVLCWWAWSRVHVEDWQTLWRSVPLWGWMAAALLWFLSFVLRAQRLQQEWRWKLKAPWHEAMGVVLVHNAAVLLLPLRAGELGYPLLVRRVYGASLGDALRSLMWLRLQDLVVLGTLALLLWPGLSPGWRLLAMPGLALFVLPACCWRRILSPPEDRASPGPALRGGASRLGAARRFLDGLARRQDGLPRWGIATSWWLSLGNWLIKIVVVAALLQAMTSASLPMGDLQVLGAALGGELAALIPVQGPGGLGPYEVGVWVGSGLPLSAAPLLGLAALLVHVFCLTVSLSLAGFWRVLYGHAGALPTTAQH